MSTPWVHCLRRGIRSMSIARSFFLIRSHSMTTLMPCNSDPRDVRCELLDEIHCAVLKRLVNDEKDQNGQIQINLPESFQNEPENDDSHNDTKSPSPSPEPELRPRATRSSLAKIEAAELKAVSAQNAKIHLGVEVDQCVTGYGWRSRLRKRDLSDGRWVVVVIGLLTVFASVPRMKQRLEALLINLAPPHMKPN